MDVKRSDIHRTRNGRSLDVRCYLEKGLCLNTNHRPIHGTIFPLTRD